MSTFDLTDEMHNGATVSDWLGTAMSNAQMAGGWLADIRNGASASFEDLEYIALSLQSAHEDVKSVLKGYSKWKWAD